MSGPAGESQGHRSGADGRIDGVVVVVKRGDRYLVIRRAAGVVAGGGWCFVGGAIEPGESQADAVVREFREEVGGAAHPLHKVWQYDNPDGRLRLHWWAADAGADGLSPNPSEVQELRWCTAGEIRRLPHVLESNLQFLREVAAPPGCVDDPNRSE